MLFPPRRLGKVRTYAAAASLGASVFVPGTALAQSAQTLEELVIVGNRFPVPRSQVATSISVLSTQQIRDYGSFTLTDILRQTAAVGASSNGGVGSLSSVAHTRRARFRTLAAL